MGLNKVPHLGGAMDVYVCVCKLGICTSLHACVTHMSHYHIRNLLFL